MEEFNVYETPVLRDGVLIAAFAGWNDAAGVATWAVRYLIERWAAVKCADIEPEQFYVFTETRPNVRLAQGTHRRIVWPANEFHYYRSPDLPRDFLLLLGVEPQLHWKTFVRGVLSFAKQCEVRSVVFLGGLLGDVPHTIPVRISGSATDVRMSRMLRLMRVEMSRYEGPTGILGVLSATARDENMGAASMWGNVPHYLSGTPNPKVTLALLDRLNRLLSLGVDLSEMERLVPPFETQVNEAIQQNPQVADYVRQLEKREGKPNEERPSSTPSELPSGEVIIKELEEFLRRRREGGEKEEDDES